MTAPRFGRCGDCAAWRGRDEYRGHCVRSPPTTDLTDPDMRGYFPKTGRNSGCFDWIENPSKEGPEHG